MRRGWITAAAIAVLAAGCAHPPPKAVPPTALSGDEFAARAAALAKSCELIAVYLGNDDRRAAILTAAARAEALEGVRRAPDAARGAVFARVYERLDAAAVTLEGVGDYNLPLSEGEYDRLRADLVLSADELRPMAAAYYEKLARRYEGPRRPRPPEMGPLAATATAAPGKAAGGAPAETAAPPPSLPPPAAPAPTASPQ